MEKNKMGIRPRHNYFRTFYPKRAPKTISTDSYKKVELISFLRLNAAKRNPNRLSKCIQLLDNF